jgi:transcriptional regulator with XRE-family HTH domain
MNRIKCLRRSRKLTQAALAAELHVDQTAVSNWEKGKNNIDIQTMKTIADMFSVPIDFVCGRPFNVKRPMSQWHPSMIEDYENAGDAKDYLLFKFGLGYFEDHSDTENEKPTVVDDGLSEGQKALIEFAKTVPEDKVELVLKLMRTILEAD